MPIALQTKGCVCMEGVAADICSCMNGCFGHTQDVPATADDSQLRMHLQAHIAKLTVLHLPAVKVLGPPFHIQLRIYCHWDQPKAY